MKVRSTIVATAGLLVAATFSLPVSDQAVTAHAAETESVDDALSWPTHCLDEVPDSPADYQEAFDHRTGGWAGADGAWPIHLPDDRIMWLFGDTLMGEIDENNALLPGAHFLRSVQIQDGNCFTPMTRGTLEEPTSFFPDLDGVAFWPSGGYVDTSVSPPVLRVVSSGVCNPPEGWLTCTVKIHTLSLPDFDVLSVDPVPYDPEARNMPRIGAQFFRDGEYIYLEGPAGGFQRDGHTGRAPFDEGTYVARIPADQLADRSAWRYWTGDEDHPWTRALHRANPIEFDDPEYPEHIPPGGIIRWGDGYLRTGKRGWLWVFGTPVYAWTSDSPAGPWTLVRGADGEPVDLVPDVTFPQTRMNYGGFLVTNVPGTSPTDPMLVFSTNGLGCADVPCTPDNEISLNMMLYGPHFYPPAGLP